MTVTTPNSTRSCCHWLLTLAVCAAGCGSDAPPEVSTEPTVTLANADCRVLFLGNSHTSFYDLPEIVKALCEEEDPQTRVYVEMNTYDGFLVDQAKNPDVLRKIQEVDWDVLVLQAQKYSTSGRYEYPTTGAEELTALAHEKGARVIMFPEWRRKGHPDEAVRVHALHKEIVSRTGAEVAPVGLAWDAVLDSAEPIELHSSDGNHCNGKGAYLTACVLYAAIRGKSPEGLAWPKQCPLSPAEAAALQSAAWTTAQRERAEPAAE